jgi:dihydroorotate dehydrogenase (fumarate)
MDLSTVYMSLKLRNPLIVGSSGLTGSVDKVRECADAGAGAVVLKSLFEEQIEAELGHLSDDRWYPEAADYIDNYGLENALGKYLELLEGSRKATDIPVIPSIHCFGTGKWVEFARKLESAGASAIELNAFILPSDPRRTGRENENVILDIVSDIKSQVSIPVAVKIGSHFSSISSFIRELDGNGIDGIVLFNRFFSIDFDIENLKVVDGSPYSSPEETQSVLRWTSLLSPMVSCDLCSTTGIHDGSAVVKHLLAGASAVQVSSAIYLNGLGIIAEMHGFLAAWMKEHNYGSIDDFRGRLSASRSGNPAEVSRVQFMKTSVKARD